MHDTRIDIIVSNAFDGIGDIEGSDDYGYSFAGIDLHDYLSIQGFEQDIPSHVLSAMENADVSETPPLATWLATHPDMAGCRYAMAFWEADGSRRVEGYETKHGLRERFLEHVYPYLEWLDSTYPE